MNIRNQTAAQTGFQTGLNAFQICRRFVRGDDNLASFFNQGIECVEKLFLRGVFAAHELNVVNHQNVNRTELFLESCRVFVTQSANKLIHKLFGRKINNVAGRILLLNVPGNCMHQVRLAQTDAGI